MESPAARQRPFAGASRRVAPVTSPPSPLSPALQGLLEAAAITLGLGDDAQVAFETLYGEGHALSLDDRFAMEAHVLGVAPEALPSDARKRAMEGYYGLRWEGFTLIGETRNDPIEVVPHDPVWRARFEVWRAKLADALGEAAVRIEHVGSTSVPGLAAKPIVDIQVSMRDLEDEASYVPAIEGLGVGLRSRDKEHRYFRPVAPRPRHVQIHVCQTGSRWEFDHLLFRDFLRAHDHERDVYAVVKMQAARTFRDNRVAYTEGKSPFIKSALARARTWHAEQGGTGA